MRYVTLSMPRKDAERLLLLAQAGAVVAATTEGNFANTRTDREVLGRVRAMLTGRDLRATNQHNTHKPKRPRVGLDLRRKSA